MKTQFLYHPENDKHIASSIIKAIDLKQSYPLEGKRVSDVNTHEDELYNAIKESDVLILFIGTKFKKIAPFIWLNAIEHKTAIVGIDIHTIPDEWGNIRRNSGSFFTNFTTECGVGSDLIEFHELPKNQDGISYIQNNINQWCEQAINNVKSNCGHT